VDWGFLALYIFGFCAAVYAYQFYKKSQRLAAEVGRLSAEHTIPWRWDNHAVRFSFVLAPGSIIYGNESKDLLQAKETLAAHLRSAKWIVIKFWGGRCFSYSFSCL
jgi:hypothetical protein